LGRSAGHDLKLHLLDAPTADAELRAAARSLLLRPDGLHARPLDEERTAGYVRLDDLHGEPCGLLRFVQRRSLYLAGKGTLRYLLWAILVTGLIHAVVTLLLLRSQVLTRLVRLGAEVHDIATRGAFEERVGEAGADELSALAQSINQLLATVGRSRQALQERETYVRAVYESVDVPILVVDVTQDRVVGANNAAGELLRSPVEQLIGKRRTALPVPAAAAGNLARAPTPAGRGGHAAARQTELRLHRGSGDSVPVLHSVVQARLGGTVHRIESLVDIRAQKATEAELRLAKEAAEAASRSRIEFVTGVGHDLRTPLSGVAGALDLLLASSLDANQRICAGLARASAGRVLDLVDDLVDLARLEVGRLRLDLQDFDLCAELEELLSVVSTLRAHPDVALVLRYRPGAPRWLHADRRRLRRVVTNLVANAVKFTSKGHVLLEVDVLPRADASGQALHLRVRDTGIGIARGEQDAVFERFTQADQVAGGAFGGSGLGLAISRQLVAHLEGSLEVASESGEGSQFTLELPVTLAAVPPQEEKLTAGGCAGLRVLLVEPHDVGRRAMEELLLYAGARCAAVDVWPAALGQLEQARQQGEPYDAVVVSGRAARLSTLVDAACAEQTRQPRWVLLVPVEHMEELRTLRCPPSCVVLTLPLRPSHLLRALARDGGGALPPPSACGPAMPAAPAAHRGRQGAEPPPGNGLRVLVVDDDPATRLVMVALLRSLGCSAESAPDGPQALRRFQEWPAELVIVDLHMRPLDGPQTLTRLRALPTPHATAAMVVACSAAAREQVERAALRSGFDGAVAKPVDPARLRDLVQCALQARGHPPEPVTSQASATPSRAEAPETALPTLDEAVALEQAGGDSELMAGLWKVLLDTGPADGEALLRALRQGDRAKIEERGHRLKGALAQAGARRCHASVLEIERLNRGSGAGPPGALAEALAELLDELWEELRAWLAAGD